MTETLKYEIAVIGAGPAGSMAACRAAAAGKRVCLIERKERAGVPVRCGEGIGLKGFSLGVDVRDSWILSSISKVVMISPSGIRVDVGKIDQSYIIDREVMDSDLVDMATEKGTEYFPGTPILSIKREGDGLYLCRGRDKNFLASCVIIADGVESRLARDLGWKTALSGEDVETCAFCRLRHDNIPEGACAFYVGTNVAPNGYAWVFPRGKNTANVGLGIAGFKSEGGKAKELLLDFIDKNFPGAEMTHLHCGGVPVGKWLKPLVKEGAMVVGDAARQVHCMTGAGIAYSLIAGSMAGETAAESFVGERVDYKLLKRYEIKWRLRYGKQQMRSYSLKKTVFKEFDDKMLDRIASSLAKKEGARLSYLLVFLYAFARHPILLIKAFLLFK